MIRGVEEYVFVDVEGCQWARVSGCVFERKRWREKVRKWEHVGCRSVAWLVWCVVWVRVCCVGVRRKGRGE